VSVSDYLNDHLAGETLGVELATRASTEHKGTPLGVFLELLSWELEEDRDALVDVMGELGVRRKRIEVILAGIADRAGRLRLTGSSPLSTLAALESLDLRINGKLDMWNALRSSVGDRVDDIDFDELISRTERQAEALERHRLAAAANALSYRDRSAAPRSSTNLAAAY
jgi:hypothetical protein